MIKFTRTQIVFQEVPDEISYAFVLSCCPGMCDGCHSSELRQSLGTELTTDVISSSVASQARFITCVLFLGGDNDPQGLAELVRYTKNLGFRTAVYSGMYNNSILWNLQELDYLKLGPWVAKKGPLGSSKGNQVMYFRDGNSLIDVTYKFTDAYKFKGGISIDAKS